MERDFTYIDDIVNGVTKIIEKNIDAREHYKIYNIGNNKPENLLSFIEIIEKCLGKKSRKNFLPMQPGDVVRTYANIDNLYDEIGYKPITHIEKGLEKFIDWYKSYYI